jgi:DNA-binding transcriptional regulator/RsmH inhibitor MraZ
MQDIGYAINSENQQVVEEKVSRIAQEITTFMGEDNIEIFYRLIKHYQSEYEFFKMNFSFNDESKEMMQSLVSNSQLLTFDTIQIANIPQENRYVLVAMLLQEVFMIMGMVNIKEIQSGNQIDMISQKEYDDEDFNIKEKMAKAIAEAKNTNQVFYEKADFAYSPTDKVVCNICHNFFASSGIQRHVGACSKKYVESSKSESSSYLFKIYDKYMPDYFLHVLISEEAQLGHIDNFLRDIWLECCGHMSAFRQDYDELKMDDYVECLTHAKKTEYTYDFGSSTNLIIEFKKEFHGTQEHLIKLVARNTAIKASCHRCENKEAKFICTECMYGGDEIIFCADCVKKHIEKYHDGESYMISNFVNSPRTGVCGYGATELEF